MPRYAMQIRLKTFFFMNEQLFYKDCVEAFLWIFKIYLLILLLLNPLPETAVKITDL